MGTTGSQVAQFSEEELVETLDRYSAWNEERGISRCPWCGSDIDPAAQVVTIDGRRGMDASLTYMIPETRTYHPKCRRKRTLIRRAIENEKLGDFGEIAP